MPKQYIKAEFLGKGGFAECYKVIEVSKEKREYACKIISKKDYFDERKKELAQNRKVKLEREVKIMKNLKHEHLVRLNHFFEDRENIYLLMDLCSHQSLHDLVQRRGCLTEVEVRYFMKQFVEGVGCMQKNNVMHRDLKIGNTFIDS